MIKFKHCETQIFPFHCMQVMITGVRNKVHLQIMYNRPDNLTSNGIELNKEQALYLGTKLIEWAKQSKTEVSLIEGDRL